MRLRCVWSIVAAAFAAGAAICGVLWLFPTPHFPQPTGPHGIGTRVFYWTDLERPEPFTLSAEDHRQLVVQIWYPSGESGPSYPYIDRPETLLPLAERLHVPLWLLGNLQQAPTHAVLNAKPALGPHPVLINPTGLSGFRAVSLFWIEELVSHGYVVVTLDQPGTAGATVWSDGTVTPLIADIDEFDQLMPLALSLSTNKTVAMNEVSLPGGIIPFLADDLSFLLDQLAVLDANDPDLARTLDLEQIGAFGMSLGGYVAPEACYRDPRFKACLAIDAGQTDTVARNGLVQPTMVISRDARIMREERSKAGGWPDVEIEHTISSQRALFEHARGDAYYVTMNGMYHVNWTDAPTWTPLVRWFGLAGPVDPYLGFELTNSCMRSFFDHYLKPDLNVAVCNDVPNSTELELEARSALEKDT